MEPVDKLDNHGQNEVARPREQPTMVDVKVNRAELAPVATHSHLFLFQYVTMLTSGLIALGLAGTAGYSLLDHWLGNAAKTSAFSEFVYSFHLWLAISLVLFAGLHIWMRTLTAKADQESQSSSSRVFLAIFLTILAITIISAFGAIVYVGVDMLLGTGNYSMKSTWLTILNSLQVIAWSSLLWWYFKRPRINAIVYAAAAGVISIAVVILLVVFPILSKRDAVIDSRTSSDLTTISSAINKYAEKNNKLPANLNELKIDDDKVATRIGSYEYKVKPAAESKPETDPYASMRDLMLGAHDTSLPTSSILSYTLCANFKTDTTKNEDGSVIPLFYSPSESSRHPSGRHCFDRTAYGSRSSSESSGTGWPASPEEASTVFSEG